MAIKTLQNNFTTPEQSKRLLELGVPADSADFHYIGRIENCIYYNRGKTISEIQSMAGNSLSFPCWSVGRLIEIYCLCTGVEDIKISLSEISLVELMVKLIEILVNAKSLNFSKLEE